MGLVRWIVRQAVRRLPILRGAPVNLKSKGVFG